MELYKIVWPAFAKRYHRSDSPVTIISFHSDDVSLSDSFSTDSDSIHVSEKVIKQFLLTPLYDLIKELYMIRSFSQVEHFKVSNMDYETLDQRFGETSEYFDKRRLNCTYTDMDKIEKEIATIIYLLDTLIQEVVKHGTVIMVRKYINNMWNMILDEHELFQMIEEKRKMVKRLHQFLNEMRKVRLTYDSCRDFLSILKIATEFAQLEVKYSRNWEQSRYEQNKLKLALAERNYNTLIHQTYWKIFQEEHCHNEIQAFIKENQSDYQKQIDTWMETYDLTLEKKEAAIYSLRMQVEELRGKYATLKLKCEERAREIEEWLAHKRRKKEEEKFLNLQSRAATKIQVWWRSIMVTKHTGPHRKLNEKRRKNKKK